MEVEELMTSERTSGGVSTLMGSVIKVEIVAAEANSNGRCVSSR